MENCAFCNIVSGIWPSYKVYEDEKYLGFLDIRPLNPGNVLLVPKKHYRWTYDVENFGEYWELAKKVGLAILKTQKALSINYVTVGEEVPHAHIRIIPRYKDDGNVIVLNEYKQKLSDEKMKEVASSLFVELSSPHRSSQ
ncbi:MAG: HIT domain-containing protein [Patescibacteria group bacterium]|jgi:histidine triad (HIT) family protein